MHELDNVIWNSILHDNKKLSDSTEMVGVYRNDVAPFAGMKEYNTENFETLLSLITQPRSVVFITGFEIEISYSWTLKMNRVIDQMEFTGNQALSNNVETKSIIPLNDNHISQMLSLTKLTAPGPFFRNTILFGKYHGIFDGDRLVSMAGLRLCTSKYKEISAVCTHPDYLGKGFASILLRHLISDILNSGCIPFLHVRSDNAGAIRVYEKLGFALRSKMYLHTVTPKNKSGENSK